MTSKLASSQGPFNEQMLSYLESFNLCRPFQENMDYFNGLSYSSQPLMNKIEWCIDQFTRLIINMMLCFMVCSLTASWDPGVTLWQRASVGLYFFCMFEFDFIGLALRISLSPFLIIECLQRADDCHCNDSGPRRKVPGNWNQF